MQIRTKATVAGYAAVVVFLALGVGVGFFVRGRIDHTLSSAIAPVVVLAVPMYQLLLAPLVFLGVRGLVAPGVKFSFTTYSRERVRIDGQVHMVERGPSGTSQSSTSRKSGAIMLAIALGAFAIGALILYAQRNAIG
jgi:hypothetical protein